jgi:hypothetical protein
MAFPAGDGDRGQRQGTCGPVAMDISFTPVDPECAEARVDGMRTKKITVSDRLGRLVG